MSGPAFSRTDPVTAAVIGGALESIAIEMGHKLTRMSYSSIIRESEDFGAAILDPSGRQLAESTFSTPLQLGPIPGYMRGIFRLFEARGQTFEPGDVVLHNSAYWGASHGPDLGVAVPVFVDGDLVGYAFTTAHHLDIGALTPGSCGIVDATDAYAEGLQFKAIKLYAGGVRQDFVWQLIEDNVRASALVIGDLQAQVSAARIGAERFGDLVRRYGLERIMAASEDLMDYSELRMRQAIRDIPDGTYRAVGYIDGYLDDPNPARRDLPIAVAVTVFGSDIVVDLTGTADQVSDRPINMPLEGTVDVSVYLTLRSILLDAAVTDPVPQNEGISRPITIIAPRGSLANPIFPAPTIARFCPGNVVADTLMHALAPVLPDRVSGGVGNLKIVAYTGHGQDDYWVYMDITEGSYGGRAGKDGMDGVDTLYANTRNNPIEDIESHYPLRVTRYELTEGRSGPGEWRGGQGSVRDVMFLEDGYFSVEGEGNKYAPWGILGGRDGTPGLLVLNPDTPDERQLPSKISYHPAPAGSVLRTVSPCGGGYGDPLDRDPERVAADVTAGFVPRQAATSQYGVVLGHDGQPDYPATRALRDAMRASNTADAGLK